MFFLFLFISSLQLLTAHELNTIDHIIGIRIQFQKEKESFNDLNGNDQWDENEPIINDLNDNNRFDYWDMNGNNQFDTFEHFDNPLTSGLGTFMTNENPDEYYARMDLTMEDIPSEIDSQFFNEELMRSNYCSGFLVDRPPHNKQYFQNQIIAVRNYFKNISNQSIDFTFSVLDNVYTLSNQMEEYAKSDYGLAQLFVESFSLDQLKQDIASEIINIGKNKNFLIVIFHAGTSQDFDLPGFDNTIYDIKSAFIDDSMMGDLEYPAIQTEDGDIEINRIIILPETQNMIYYRSIEEIFFSENDFCDYQVGLTGTFAFWLGYAMGLPQMYDVDSGNTGIGKFGLMDIGSNNGRGIIPSPPNPWTRLLVGWSNAMDITSHVGYESNEITLSSENEVVRIDIDDDEYFLIENRNNWLGNEINTSIDSLRWKNKIDDSKKGHWFDTLIKEANSVLTFSEDSVITSVDSYDYGLPGSGILIWHIKEPDNLENGVNNDLNNRYVQLEEADGAIDIGYESYNPFFDAQTTGWGYDFWYADNYYYFNYGGNSKEQNDNGSLIFSNNTNPNTKTSKGAETNLSIKISSQIGKSMTVEFRKDLSENYLIEEYSNITKVVGAIDGSVFYVDSNNKICKMSADGEDLSWDKFDYSGSEYVITDSENNSLIVESKNYYCDNDDCSNLDPVEFDLLNNFSIGYYSDFDQLEIVDGNASLGDIDNDGKDEKVWIENNKVYAENSSGIPVSDFPFEMRTSNHRPLLADINRDDKVDLIFKTDRGIEIVDLNNFTTMILPLKSSQDDCILVKSWKQDSLAVVAGNRFYIFPQNLKKTFWVTEYGTYSHYPISLVEPADRVDGHSLAFKPKAYNYPNPVEDSFTKLRFYSSSSENTILNIYNSLGANIYSYKIDNLHINDYNEFIIDRKIFDFQSGLYFVELKYQGNEESELVKMLWIK